MLDRIRIGRFQPRWLVDGTQSRAARRVSLRPQMEAMESRPLMASLAPLSNVTVPTLQGEAITLDGTGTTDPQTFTVTSSNPAVVASVPSQTFWTLNVSYSSGNTTFSGPLTFQLFGNLTPTTAKNIDAFTNDGYYNNTGKYITRIINGFPNSTGYVIQGGAPNSNGTGSSGQPGTPFNNENLQQLAFTGTDQIAMANAGINTNDTQYFITTGSPNSELGYNYTIFGQLVPNPTTDTPAQTLLGDLTAIPVTTNGSGENSLPVVAPTYTAATSTSNPSGTVIIDTTQAAVGQTSTITVTAHDAVTNTTTSQSFLVTVGSYTGPTTSSLIQTINFKPLAQATNVTTSANAATSVTLDGLGTFPDSSVTQAQQDLSYALVSQPAHGTVTNFNASTGTLTYTPNPGYTGTDTFQYQVTSAGPNTSAPAVTSNAGTVTVSVGAPQPVATGAVRVVGTSLIITPVPRTDHGTNHIDVVQVPSTATSTTPVIEVYVNNQLDSTEPAVSTLTDIVVSGGKDANNVITVDPSVTLPSLLAGAPLSRNRLVAGSSETRMHGWFGHTTMIGGTGPNQMIGRTGQVKFKPSKTTDLIFTGAPVRRSHLLYPKPPTGTFYVYKKGQLIPVPLSHLTSHSTTSQITIKPHSPSKKK